MTGTTEDGVIRNGKKITYSAEFKVRVVLESLQRDTTLEEVKRKFGISAQTLHTWRDEFKRNAPQIFSLAVKRQTGKQGSSVHENPDELKRIIGELTVQNEILKKVQGLLG